MSKIHSGIGKITEEKVIFDDDCHYADGLSLPHKYQNCTNNYQIGNLSFIKRVAY